MATVSFEGAEKWVYRSTKTYDHNEGLSCCFRQWRASSHCNTIHGYALSFKFIFVARELDPNHWCYDFGALKPVRNWLHEMFDHTLLVAEDDPEVSSLKGLQANGLADIRLVPAVGCEATARLVFDHVSDIIIEGSGGRVLLESVEVREHGGNSAIYSKSVA